MVAAGIKDATAHAGASVGIISNVLSLHVPTDTAIIGYDDIEFDPAVAVPLTSVRQPRHALGRTAAEFLLDEATDPDHRPHRRLLPTRARCPRLLAAAAVRGAVARSADVRDGSL